MSKKKLKYFIIKIDTEFDYYDNSKEEAIDNFLRDNKDLNGTDFEIIEVNEDVNIKDGEQ